MIKTKLYYKILIIVFIIIYPFQLISAENHINILRHSNKLLPLCFIKLISIGSIGLIIYMLIFLVAITLCFILIFRNKNLKNENKAALKNERRKFEEIKRLCNTFEVQLRFTLAGAKAGSIFYKCDTKKITLDNKAREILGIGNNEKCDRLENWFDKVISSDAELLESRFFDAIKNKHFLETTFQLKPLLNIKKDVSLQAYIDRNKDNYPTAVYGLITDISEKKRKEELLIQNENRFRLIFEKTKNGVMLIDTNGIIQSANHASSEILEMNSEEIIGQKYDALKLELIYENGKKYSIDEWPSNIALNTGKEVKGKTIGIVSTKKIKWVKVDAVPIINQGNLWPHMIYLHFQDISQQRKMINELQRSEIKYRNLADNALIGIFRATVRGEVSYVNKSLSDLLEYNSQIDVIGKNPMFWFEIDKDRRYFYQSLKDNIKVENFHTILKTSKRNKINVIINAQWINDGISGMVMDITEIIKTRDELKQSREDFLRIFSSIQEGYIRFGQKGRIIRVNPSVVKILGYNEINDLENKFIHKRIFNKSESLEEIIELLNHKGKINAFPVTMKKSTGKIITADCNIQYIEDNNPANPSIELTFRDITYRKKVEDALKTLLELNKIMDSYNFDEMVNHGIEEAVRLTDSKCGFFHFVNEETKSISLQAWSKETIRNCEVPEKIEHYPIDIAGVWVECIQMRKPVIHNNYKDLKHKKGLPEGHFPLIREMVVPIFEGNKIVAIIGVGNKDEDYNEFDIDQLSLLSENIWSIIRRKKAENAIIVEKNIAENANKAKSIFLANVSHEIRTPMNAVIGFSELLMNQIEDPIQMNYLESIKTSGNSLLHIINDILDLSKIEAGRMDVNPEPSSIKSIFEDVKHIFSLKAKQKELEFILNYQSENQYLFNIDELRVRQILLNLIGNSIKFTNEGYVKVNSHYKIKGKRKNTCTLYISVEDSGIGISVEAINSIFESFRQQEEQDIKKYGGTGLGLAISKRLAELMNGEIVVESTLNKGSKFTLVLNNVKLVKKEKEITDVSDTTTEKIKFLKSKLLVVDDILVNRELIKGIFKNSEVEVLEAQNGQEAIMMSNEFKPDLILMDIRMPVMDGYAATKTLKSDKATYHIPIVALTASISTKQNRDTEVVFDGFLKKPVSVNSILNEMKKFLPFNTSVIVKLNNLNKNIDIKPENLKDKPELFDIFREKIIPVYNISKNTADMNEIIEFGETVFNIGKEYHISMFEEYGNKLLNYSKSYDIENVMSLIESFSGIIRAMDEIKI